MSITVIFILFFAIIILAAAASIKTESVEAGVFVVVILGGLLAGHLLGAI